MYLPCSVTYFTKQKWIYMWNLLWGHCSFLLGLSAHKVLFVTSKRLFPKFWQLYGEVNGDLHQEGLCHIQVCCTQSPCPCSRPLLTCNSRGDTQTLKDRSGSVSVESPVHKVLFEPSEHLWQVWGLILNAILPLLLFCWGFSFFLGRGVSPQSPSSGAQLPLQCLPSCWGFSAFGRGVSPHSLSSTTQLLLSLLVLSKLCFIEHQCLVGY